MIRSTYFTITALILLTLCNYGWGQTLFTENFDYPAGDTLSHLGWEQIRNGDSLITITEPGLTYDGYSPSGIGNAAVLKSNGGQEIRNSFTSINSDSVYLSFLINISDAVDNSVAVDGLFLYLTPPDGSIFSYRMSVYVRKHESSNLLAFGVSKGSGIQFTDYQYALGTTYLIVVKYCFDAAEADKVSLWINPDLTLSESEPNSSLTVGPDTPELANIIISQLIGSNEPPDAIIDGIRITTKWKDITLSIPAIDSRLLQQYYLNQNYPNPFNPSTKISYKIAEAGFVTLKIYDVLGREIQTLVNSFQYANTYLVHFDAARLSAGVYFYELKAGDFTICKRMLLIK
ncbi:MAG: T9SS type A sorting domain-containing protein [Calditrichaceae bacterium]|nr:T9SS type A sorting domain-containing protein [Calditrichaceae bacterium]